MFSMNPQIVAFLIEQGFEPFTAASIFGATGLTGTVGLVAFGWLTDNRGRFFAMTLSYVLTFTGLCFLMAVLM